MTRLHRYEKPALALMREHAATIGLKNTAAVEYDSQGCRIVNDGGIERTDASERTEEHRRTIDEDGRQKILVHETHRPPPQLQRLHQARRILPMDRDGRRFRRDIRLAPTQRHADIRKGQRRRIWLSVFFIFGRIGSSMPMTPMSFSSRAT